MLGESFPPPVNMCKCASKTKASIGSVELVTAGAHEDYETSAGVHGYENIIASLAIG